MNPIEQALCERAAIRAERQRPGIQIDDLLALDKREAAWELRWYFRHPWDAAAAYFRFEVRRRELEAIIASGMIPDDPCDALAVELRQAAAACDDLGERRPIVPAGPVTMAGAAAWFDTAQQAIREHARELGTVEADTAARPDDPDAGEQAPAFTRAEQRVLRALATFDPSILASVRMIHEATYSEDAELSERSITPAVRRLVELGIAERPEGERQGARLTLKGRRLAAKLPIAD